MKSLSAVFIATLLLSGCEATSSILHATKIWPQAQTNRKTHGAVAPERLRAIEDGAFVSLIRAYEIPHDASRDDSAYVSKSALEEVAAMVDCPPLPDTSGLGAYRAEPIFDTSSMSIRVKVNRPNCSVDIYAVKAHMDKRIAETKRVRLENARREREMREADPRGPYFMGCSDYQRFVRGESSINRPDPKEAFKRYPRVKADYAARLYITGWEDARAYGVRSVHCGYLTNRNITPEIHQR